MSVEWRRPAEPGFVWVDDQHLIKLQRNALRARDLEDETRELQRRGAVLKARARLGDVLSSAGRADTLVTAADRDAVASLAEDPPLTAEGGLHEAAFEALVDAAVWARREQELIGAGAGGHSEETL